jgi:hypothetical protein
LVRFGLLLLLLVVFLTFQSPDIHH